MGYPDCDQLWEYVYVREGVHSLEIPLFLFEEGGWVFSLQRVNPSFFVRKGVFIILLLLGYLSYYLIILKVDGGFMGKVPLSF